MNDPVHTALTVEHGPYRALAMATLLRALQDLTATKQNGGKGVQVPDKQVRNAAKDFLIHGSHRLCEWLEIDSEKLRKLAGG